MNMLSSTLFESSDRKWYFHLLEQLYVALEELALPPPEEFHFFFAKFGIETLSRR